MKFSMNRKILLCILGLTLLRLYPPLSAQVNLAFVVYPEFRNALANTQNNPTGASSLALYSGHQGAYSTPGSAEEVEIPSGTDGNQTIKLVRSGFGQMLARTVPFSDFELETIRSAQNILYSSPPVGATARDAITASNAAFKYKELLYSQDGPDGTVQVDFNTMEDLFGDNERDKARQGIEELRQELKYAPLHKQLRNALLDAYYDFVIAEAQHVKIALARVAKLRLGLEALPPGQFIINQEIASFVTILVQYEGILELYGRLFADNSGSISRRLIRMLDRGLPWGNTSFNRNSPGEIKWLPSTGMQTES